MSPSKLAWMLGMRRLLFLSFTLPLAAGLLYLGKLTGDQWTGLVQWLGVAYFGSDAVEKVSNTRKSTNTQKAERPAGAQAPGPQASESSASQGGEA